MSWNPDLDRSIPLGSAVDAIETVIIPRARDLGGFEVRRALPSTQRQMVGPFIFFYQMGPAEFITKGGIDVRPHPRIGLGTVTYLYQGEFEHRDSLGTQQMIYPGEVNWMTAGRGVTHLSTFQGLGPRPSDVGFNDLQDLVSCLGNGRAGPKDPFHTNLFQIAIVLFRNDATDDHSDITGFCFLQFVNQLRNHSFVTRRLRRHTDDMDIVCNCLTNNFFRR